MIFLTEEDIRARNVAPGGALSLSPNERLTPAASEFAASMRLNVVIPGQGGTGGFAPIGTPSAATGSTEPACRPDSGNCSVAEASATPSVVCPETGMTMLDAATRVPKSHPRIELRGKLDSLLAISVLAQTQFDPKNRLPGFLKECLAEISGWIMRVLEAEVSGGILPACAMGGMDAETLREFSRDPARLAGLEPFCPNAALGGNVALLNWLRAQAREAEVAAVRSGLKRDDILNSLNRLSSAVYVLMLLTMAAEKGVNVNAVVSPRN